MSQKKTTESFIEEASKLHEGKYNYEKTNYQGARIKVIIGCPIHGDFEQLPTNHLRPCGCPGCIGDAVRKGRGFKPKTTPAHSREVDKTLNFIERATVVHAGKYSYAKTTYTFSKEKVLIICPEHGEFLQRADHHLDGRGCPACQASQAAERMQLSTPEFVEKASALHGEKYNYSKVKYRSSHEKIIINCPEHGDFEQEPNSHLNGSGCPKCSCFGPSKAENELFEFIKAIAPDAVQSDRTTLEGREIDILVPSKNIGFEFNGLYWHSEATGKPVKYHQEKSDQASAAGVRLIHIFEDEWRDKRAWCESHVRNVLNAQATLIYARKCEIELADNAKDLRDFLNENHLQGFRGGRAIILRHQGEIVAAAVLAKTITGETELARWCVKLNTRIVGGMARVMAHIPEGTISYCDSGKYDGAGYIAAGWEKVSEGVPSYHYTDFRSRRGRQEFQKHKLIARGAIGENEIDLAANEGFYRIGGLRQMKFIRRMLQSRLHAGAPNR